MKWLKSISLIPLYRWYLKRINSIKLPGMEGMTLHDFLELYINGIIKGALTSRAGSIAFSFFIALFPFALFLLTLIPYVPIEGFQEDLIAFVYKALPSRGTTEAVNYVLEDIANNKYGELLSFGFLLSIFLMTNGVNAILSGFEYTFHDIETRTVIRQYIAALGITLLLTLLLIVTVVVIITLELIIHNLELTGLLKDEAFWIGTVQIIIFIGMIMIGTSILYYYGTKEGKSLPFFSAGTILTTLLILINSKVFSIYLEKFSQYNKLYGSIGTVLIIMIFIWINSIILLLGFELNTSITKLHDINLEKQKNKNNSNLKSTS